MQKKASKLHIGYLVIIFIAFMTACCYLLSSVLMPFIIAGLLAYLFDPLVNKLMRLRISRLTAVMIVFVIIFMIIAILFLVFIPIIQDQISAVAKTLPNQFASFQKSMWPWVTSHLGVQTDFMATLKTIVNDNVSKVGNLSTWTLRALLVSGKHVIEAVINCVLVPVVTFYLLRDWQIVLKNIHDLLPRAIEPTVTQLAQSCDAVLSAFFRGQLLVMLALCIMYALALSLIGLEAAVLIGAIIGIASVVPYLGSIVGLIIATIAALIQFGTLDSVLLVFVIFVVGHLVENLLLAPKLIGDRVGLHPVAVIFSVLAGAKLFGFFGVLLALPVASVIMVLLRYLRNSYRRSTYFHAH